MAKFFAILFLSTTVFASAITGTVKNGTTNKPAAGDTVILLKLQEGMQEEVRTRTDSRGRFTLQVSDESAPHLIRVDHDNVNYHRPAPPGTTSVEIEVFDAAPKLAGVISAADVMRLQTSSNMLEVTEMYALENNSKPPRTLMSDKSFEIYLPAGAQLDSAMAAGPGGMAVKSAPVPMPDKGHYAFIFPVRPGETRFQLSYHLDYSGSANFTPKLSLPTEMMGIMLPKSMPFSPATPGSFETEVDENGVSVQVAKNVGPGAAPAFRVAGTGVIPRDALNGTQSKGGGEEANASSPTGRPGGGLGVPETTPDPLSTYRWYFLGGFVLVLAVGAFWVVNRPQPAALAASFAAAAGAGVYPAGRSAALMEALKEELFQLESERLQKKIAPADYERAKAALDETIARAIRRKDESNCKSA